MLWCRLLQLRKKWPDSFSTEFNHSIFLASNMLLCRAIVSDITREVHNR